LAGRFEAHCRAVWCSIAPARVPKRAANARRNFLLLASKEQQDMSEQIATLVETIKALEGELEAEFARRRAGLRFGMERGRIAFEEEVRRRHLQLKTHLPQYLRDARLLSFLTAPVIYALIVPLVFLEIGVGIYQAICFPAYGIEKVRRRDYLVFDRHHLAYLNAIEKLNCAYCSYANGLIAFVREVVARTEAHWCPIKHARRVIGAHEHYRDFADFGDVEAYRAGLAKAAANADGGKG
jgi:hypothetical protein